MLSSIIGTQMTLASVAICTGVSLAIGLMIALVYRFTNRSCTNHFLVALFLLPALVQCVIMMVNGNLGAGVAVAGAFSLVRFRSAQGSAQEITIIFLAMAVGLTCGMGYVAFALLFSIVLMAAFMLGCKFIFRSGAVQRKLKILVPEDVDYTTAFDDLFDAYLSRRMLERVKTTNMGSLIELTYWVSLKKPAQEKEFLDAIRCRNGNLKVSILASESVKEVL